MSLSLLTVSREEAADMIGVSLSTIDRMIADKTLRASRYHRRVMVRIADIEKMLTALAVA